MGQMVWSLWANYVSLSAGFALFALGLESVAYPLGTFEAIRPALDVLFMPVPIIQLFLVFASLLVMAVEWPLPGVREALGKVATDYSVRVAFYTVVGVIAILSNQTVNPGLYLLIAAGAYVQAVRNGEKDMKPAATEK